MRRKRLSGNAGYDETHHQRKYWICVHYTESILLWNGLNVKGEFYWQPPGSVVRYTRCICGRGGIGRHVWFRLICREACRFKSCHPHQIRNSRLIQSYRPTVFFLSLNISRKSLIYKGFFAFVVHFGICGAYILCLGSPKTQKSTTPRQGVVPSYR